MSREELEQQIIACTRCPRLVAYREEVARTRKPAFREQQYWGSPCRASAMRRPGC